MLPWNQRPPEIKYLFNPAFCACLLFEAIKGYDEAQAEQGNKEKGMSLWLAFLLFPLVLHKPTRELIPSSARETFYEWIHKNPKLQINFPERAKHFVPYAREGIFFGVQNKILQVTKNGELLCVEKIDVKKLGWEDKSNAKICVEKSRVLGKWFAKVGKPSVIFQLLNVKP